jgi:hypothetical protein
MGAAFAKTSAALCDNLTGALPMETKRLSTTLAARFSPARLEDVAGCLRSKRKAKTPAQMRAAIRRDVL